MFEVGTAIAGPVRLDVAAGANVQRLHVQPPVLRIEILVLPALQHPFPSSLLGQQSSIEQHALGVGPIAQDPQGILPPLDQRGKILVRPSPDGVGPLLHVLPPQLARPSFVEQAADISQHQHQRLDRGTRQLVHRGFEFFPVDRRFVHINQGMAPIVIEHYARRRHELLLFL